MYREKNKTSAHDDVQGDVTSSSHLRDLRFLGQKSGRGGTAIVSTRYAKRKKR